jgi:hypothetical protein
VPPLATTLLDVAGRIIDAVATVVTLDLLTTCGLKLNTNMSAGTLTLPSLSISEM